MDFKIKRCKPCDMQRRFKMRKQLEYKLQEFSDKRKFAETDQRKRMVDFEVVNYLTKKTKSITEFMENYEHYKDLTK